MAFTGSICKGCAALPPLGYGRGAHLHEFMSQASLRTYLRLDGGISGGEELIHRRLELAELRLGLRVHRESVVCGGRRRAVVRSEVQAWR